MKKMKRIKNVKRNNELKHLLLCMSTFIPILIFGVANWFLCASNFKYTLVKIYSMIGVCTITAALYALSIYLCKKIDKMYHGKGDDEDDEIYDR